MYNSVERVNVELGEMFNDGEHILYVNGAYRGNDDIGKLMHDFSCSDPDDMMDSEIADVTELPIEEVKRLAENNR